MDVGDCFIYATQENTCDAIDIVTMMKEKLQCAESVIRKVSKEDMLSLSFTNKHANTFKTSFEITSSFHDIQCDVTNQTESPGNKIKQNLLSNAVCVCVCVNVTFIHLKVPSPIQTLANIDLQLALSMYNVDKRPRQSSEF